uniref:Mitochondrial carrier protein n=1 Tax=Hanusia phi TaxID=3032 RepID=A0A7S0EHR4_9CRYP|mmetsp:Transcript_24821/g.56023  ORF Transcript_24821/g.56023 Transcript_24821/m.56023 type:complete len:401 (+) Transcript_24821:103-1305(+)
MMQSVRLLALVLFLIQPNVVDTFTESASSPAARSTGGNFRSAKTSFFPLLRSKISSAAELRYGLATALPQGSASTKAGNPEQSVSHLFNSKLVVDNNSFLSKVWHARHHLVAGAIGRCVAVSIMFPVDTIKTRLQLHGAQCCTPTQWSEAIKKPLFRGLSSSLIGQVPNGMLVYGSYEVYKRELSERFPSLSATQVRLMAALLGDVTGSIWLAPFERTKQRVQAGLYSGMRQGFKSTVADKGIFGLYTGYKAQVLRDMSFHAIQLPLYEAIKDLWLRRGSWSHSSQLGSGLQVPARKLQPWESMTVGAIAGATSGALTTPIDVLKTRLMASSSMSASVGSMRQVLVQVLMTEGLLGLTAGLPQRAAYIACGSAIFWTVFEQVCHRIYLVEQRAKTRQQMM